MPPSNMRTGGFHIDSPFPVLPDLLEGLSRQKLTHAHVLVENLNLHARDSGICRVQAKALGNLA